MRFNTMAWFGLGFVVTLAGMGGFEFATAGSRARDAQGAHTGAYVVAESYYGNARVTGAVRQTSLGPQVQLPGGSWVYCRTSCADACRQTSRRSRRKSARRSSPLGRPIA